ncbi:MAG TPA: thioredoxin [Nitrososphaera sp.]|jgi:thioredoxin 1|nr:thioredoxin [Nitrososphaera sp.]
MNSDDELEAIKNKKLAELQKEADTKAMMSSITEPLVLTDSNFASEVTKYPIMLVDFWAPWCGPCRMVSPIVEQLSREYSGRVAFGKVNVDENQRIATSFGIQSIPTLMIFKGSKAVDVMVGAMPKAQIEMKLKQQLLSNNDSIYR